MGVIIVSCAVGAIDSVDLRAISQGQFRQAALLSSVASSSVPLIEEVDSTAQR
jgi:hypothetical protein